MIQNPVLHGTGRLFAPVETHAAQLPGGRLNSGPPAIDIHRFFAARNFTSAFIALFFFCASICFSEAKTLTWTGNAPFFNRWSEPGNWSPAGPPVNGDTVIFPAGFTPNNDLTNLSLFSIQFTGTGSTYLTGNPIHLDSDITAANNNGEARVTLDITFNSGGGTFYTLGSSFLTVVGNVALANHQSLNLYALNAQMYVNGSVSGTGGITKLGGSHAYLLGQSPNVLTDLTSIQDGTLHLGKSNVVAISQKIVLAPNGTSGSDLTDDAPGQYPPVIDATVGNSCTWHMNYGTAVTNLSLSNGGSVHGLGILNLQCDVNVTTTNYYQCDLLCPLYLGSQTRQFHVNGSGATLQVGQVVATGTAGITKDGLGTMYLGGPNDYAGLTLVNDGTLIVTNNGSLGSSGTSSGTIVSSGAIIEFAGVTTAEPLTLNANSYIAFYKTNNLNGSLSLNGPAAIFGGDLTDLIQINTGITGVGPFGIGAGTVRFAGTAPNSFTGGVTVGEGVFGYFTKPCTLELAKPDNVLAVPGTIEVRNIFLNGNEATNTMTLRSLQNNGVQDVRLGYNGSWLLAGHSAAPRSLVFHGDGYVDTQGGQLQLTNSPGTNQIYAVTGYSIYDPPSYTALILGNLVIQAPTNTLTVSNNVTLMVPAQITGGGSLVKAGPGTVMMSGSANNNFAGDTLVTSGPLVFAKSPNAISVPHNLIIGPTLPSTTALARFDYSGGFGGSVITVNANSLLNLNGNNYIVYQLNLNDGGSAATGSGNLYLSNGGVVQVGSLAGQGSHASSSISGRIAIVPNDRITFNINPYATSAPFASAPELDVPASINVNESEDPNFIPAGFTKSGLGRMRLLGNNTYHGGTFINGGTLIAASAGALGTTNTGTFVNDPGALALDGGITITDEPVYLDSSTAPALDSLSGSNTWAGPIILSRNSNIGPGPAGAALMASGVISGTGGFLKVGQGSLAVGGVANNTYSGDTFVNAGTLLLQKQVIGGTAIPHQITVATGPTGPPATLVQQTENGIKGGVTVNSGGLWSLLGGQIFSDFGLQGHPPLTLNGNGSVQALGASLFLPPGGGLIVNPGSNTTATISGYIALNNNNITARPMTINAGANQAGNPECLVSAAIQEIFGSFGLQKEGGGTLRLTGTNTFTGANNVVGGTLWVDGLQPQSPVLLKTGTRLKGFGTVGNTDFTGSSGIISPGGSPGILSCSNLDAGALGSGTLEIELNGTTPGVSGYDQLNVSGSVNLSGLTLHAFLNYASAVNDQYTIINNDGTDAVAGTFQGLPQNAKLYIGTELFTINYTGGTGNDVTLKRLVTPPRPVLTITEVPPSLVRLVWPTNDPPFSLESTTNLTAANWTATLPLPVIIGTNNVVTNTVSDAQKFYRLYIP
ncbi:MAG: Extracellular serine protease precursor [Pedosphaera sp.]|nr:Extracellular serine protease precursor [Pedosphaera sp.]